MSVNFGGWPSGIHSDFEQVKRIESGKKLKKKIVALDKEGQRIVIQGSAAEPYQATLQALILQSGRLLVNICIVWLWSLVSWMDFRSMIKDRLPMILILN